MLAVAISCKGLIEPCQQLWEVEVSELVEVPEKDHGEKKKNKLDSKLDPYVQADLIRLLWDSRLPNARLDKHLANHNDPTLDILTPPPEQA